MFLLVVTVSLSLSTSTLIFPEDLLRASKTLIGALSVVVTFLSVVSFTSSGFSASCPSSKSDSVILLVAIISARVAVGLVFVSRPLTPAFLAASIISGGKLTTSSLNSPLSILSLISLRTRNFLLTTLGLAFASSVSCFSASFLSSSNSPALPVGISSSGISGLGFLSKARSETDCATPPIGPPATAPVAPASVTPLRLKGCNSLPAR